MQKAVIVSGARTPVGSFGGSLKDVKASDLGATAVKAALERAGLPPDEVDEIYFGNVLQSAEAGYAGRLAGLKAGIPDHVPAIAINRACSSGLEAINLAAQLIKTGEIDVAIAGGTESMSQSPYLLDYPARFDGYKIGEIPMRDALVEGLTCPVNRYHMGVGAENIQARWEITREDQDGLSMMSHQRAAAAVQSGKFKSQIAPVTVPQRRGDPIIIDTDEGPRADSSMEKLAKLRPVFKEGGTVTAGNASSINDGAAVVVIMSEEKAKSLGIKPRLRWHTRGIAGVDPAFFGIGPVPAVNKALKKSGMTIKDIDQTELNEAFAVQALYCIRELNMDIETTNVNGSGIGLGHPIGATGAIQTVKLMEEMEARDDEIGMVTMCVGGGMGVATIFERVN
jgi:acetyl-CoA C-acetyltransferase